MRKLSYRIARLLLNDVEVKDVIEVSNSLVVSKDIKIPPKVYLDYKLKDGTQYNLIGWNFTTKLNPERFIISIDKDEYTLELELSNK